MKRILITLLLLFASPAFAVTYDTATSTSTGASDAQTTSHSHTTAVQTNRVMYVALSLWRQSAANVGECTSVTYNSVAATRLQRNIISGTTQLALELWRLIAPATGANTVAVTCDSAVERIVTGVITAYDVDQSTPDGGVIYGESTTGSGLTLAVTGSAVGELVFAGFTTRVETTACAPGSGETERWDVVTSGSGSDPRGCGYTEAGAAGTVNIIPTYTGASTFVAAHGVSINTAPPVSAVPAPRMIQ